MTLDEGAWHLRLSLATETEIIPAMSFRTTAEVTDDEDYTRMLHKSLGSVLSRPLDTRLFGPFGACASSSQQVKITRTWNRCHSRCRAHRQKLCMRSTNR